ncbi:uncharacterized protein LOC131145811 [Malania oleifera]|uniref:uncharacterized protein LOC131145811 n=1 Tax=Malania oleifera TaxID=397392 RepID=UPI0025AE4185|nr:uncharacterized protein LOC131145811 [Malania oleifera]
MHPHPTPNPFILNYLIKTFKFSRTRAQSISNRFSFIKALEKPQSVVQFLKSLGFLDTHIVSSVHVSPQILFADVDRTLKPKLHFFQELGLVGTDLGKFISKNSTLLTVSLDRKLIPCVEILKKILLNDDNNENLIRVMRRCNWVISKDPKSRLLCNISLLESCGIVGSQLSMLLKRQPRLFIVRESELRDLLSRVVAMGFLMDSRMLVHAIYSLSCISDKTLRRKFELFQNSGFSEVECREMFRKAPGLLRTSDRKLSLGIEFFMNTVKLNKVVLVRRPSCLMHSMEDRVIPRYRVLHVLMSQRLLKKKPSFINVLNFPEEEFLEKFVLRFEDDAEELLEAYKGDILDSSSME